KAYASGATGIWGHLVGGWQVNTIAQFQSGVPFSIGNNCCEDHQGTIRGAYAPGRTRPPKQDFRKTGFAFDPTAFVDPTSIHGTTSYNDMRGGGINNWNIAVFKNFHLTEATRLQFRAELFNAFNHAQFGTPTHVMGDSNFGKYTIASLTGNRAGQGPPIVPEPASVLEG